MYGYVRRSGIQPYLMQETSKRTGENEQNGLFKDHRLRRMLRRMPEKDGRQVPCAREHHVQFCGICEEFPCEKFTEMILWNPGAREQMASLRDEYYRSQREKEAGL